MTTLVFDTETTGLPQRIGFDKYYPIEDIDKYKGARLIEFAYILYERNGKEIKRQSYLIKSDSVLEIPNSEFHGITYEMVSQNGVYLNDIIPELISVLSGVKNIVAHNILFDIHILLSEFYRIGNLKIIDIIRSKGKKCTQCIGQNYMQQFKYPKLQELYKFIIGETLNQSHRALDDTEAAAKCYFGMMRAKKLKSQGISSKKSELGSKKPKFK